WPRRRSGPAGHAREPGCSGCRSALRPAEAGPQNSLGLAKSIFPNADNIYMHGTPAQQLFSRTRRDFSHGCIRLEAPARLAEWVLRDNPGWTRERIDKAMQGDRPTQVNLRERLRVVI